MEIGYRTYMMVTDFKKLWLRNLCRDYVCTECMSRMHSRRLPIMLCRHASTKTDNINIIGDRGFDNTN